MSDRMKQYITVKGFKVDINKTDCHVISEILLKVALNIITSTPNTSKWKLTEI